MFAATVSSSSSLWSVILRGLSPSHIFHGRNNGLLTGNRRSSVSLPSAPITGSIRAFSGRSKSSAPATSSKKNKTRIPENDGTEEDDIDEDAIEALFSQLEEDLKMDLSADDNDEELTEEELAKLEQELEEAFGDGDDLSEMFYSSATGTDDESEVNNDEDEDDNDEEEERSIKLKNWQLRRLASALKIGRRKTSIKSLAAELCLDRAVVLEMLRDPPPELLLMSAALPDKVVPTNPEPETKTVDPSPPASTADFVQPEPKMNMPVHVMQRRWSMQKRLKKVHVETLERVYIRTKRPTNAMISNIVHVTNLPRKRIVQWFEEKRSEEGVPDHRLPYQRSISDTVFTNKSV